MSYQHEGWQWHDHNIALLAKEIAQISLILKYWVGASQMATKILKGLGHEMIEGRYFLIMQT